MPIAGLGLHILVALYFAVHAMRHRQQMYWLIVLFSFPVLGSVVYFFAIYLPNSRLEYGARKVVSAAVKSLDPTRELREARVAFDYTPTAQNQMRLAAALLDSGAAEESANTYQACLNGAFANDLDIRLGAAQAYLACARAAEAIAHLQFIRQTNPDFRAEAVTLAMAHSLSAAGRPDQAQREFEHAIERFASFASRAEYAIWAAGAAKPGLVQQQKQELDRTMARWSRHTRSMNAGLLKRLNGAYAALKKD